MTAEDQMEMVRDAIEQALHDIYEDYGERGNPIWHSDRIAYAVMNALASVDTLPKGQDAQQGLAGTESGAVPHEDAADARTPQDTSHKRMGE